MDIKPGRVVDLDGSLYLVEAVRLDVTMQKIESLRGVAERNAERLNGDRPGDLENHTPVFCHLHGELGDETSPIGRLKVLFPDGEAE